MYGPLHNTKVSFHSGYIANRIDCESLHRHLILKIFWECVNSSHSIVSTRTKFRNFRYGFQSQILPKFFYNYYCDSENWLNSCSQKKLFSVEVFYFPSKKTFQRKRCQLVVELFAIFQKFPISRRLLVAYFSSSCLILICCPTTIRNPKWTVGIF